jgi:hypothetical protein
MPDALGRPDYDAIRALLRSASIHLRLVFGLTTTRPSVSYLDTFSFGHHTARNKELRLTQEQEDHAFAALEHCATYLAAVQIHTALKSVHGDPFHLPEEDIASAFQISRLLRNAFAHNPFNPIWEVRDAWKNQEFVVPGVITVNTTDLDGVPVGRKHYGGPIAILRLIEYADRVIQCRGAEFDPGSARGAPGTKS